MHVDALATSGARASTAIIYDIEPVSQNIVSSALEE